MKGDILEVERLVVGSCAGVFAWSEQVVECDTNDVGEDLGNGSLDDVMGDREQVDDDGNGEGFDPDWRSINLLPEPQLPADAVVGFACEVLSDVTGPQ